MKKSEVVPGAKPKKKGKVCIAVGVVAILGVIAIGSAFKNVGEQVEMISNAVEIEPVQYRDLSESISLKGTVSGESKTNVMSVASAEVTAVNVQVGDVVEEGTPLVTLDMTELEEQAADLQKDIRNANALAQNETVQLNQNLSETQEDQSNALSKSQQTINRAQSDYDKIKRDIEENEKQQKDKRDSLSKAEKKEKECKEKLERASDKYNEALNAVEENDNDDMKKKLNEKVEEASADLEEITAECGFAAEEVASIKTVISNLEDENDAYKKTLESAQIVIEDAKQSYEDTMTSTNRSVAAAQNTVDMSAYQSDGRDELNNQLENLQKQLSDCSLNAPCGGVVTAVNVSVGDNYIGGQTMVTIENTSKMKVIVNVEEADILKVQEGMKAVVTTDATGEEEISGTITRVVRVKNQSINPNASDVNTSTGYSAEISIDNTELLVGMTAKAKIVLTEKANVLAVPYDLIQTDDAGNTFVLVAEKQEDGTVKAVRRNIEAGEEVDYYTEITGGDLKEGEQLIYDNTYSVVEGQIFTPEQMYSEQDLGLANDTAVEAE